MPISAPSPTVSETRLARTLACVEPVNVHSLPPTIPHHSLALFSGARGTIAAMKIATFNVNGVNGRLPVLLRWLEETSPDVVCLQELKSETFPQSAVRAAGYEAIWQGQKAGTASPSSRAARRSSRPGARSPATMTTPTAATLRPPSTAS
jgi:hypothetical protein